MTNYKALIPELSDWNNGKGIDVVSWIGCVCDYEKAIGYSALFWPTFVEIDGLIVRDITSEENLKGFAKEYNGDRKKTESTVNHLHIRDIQYWGCPGATPERMGYLGNVIKAMWECKLKLDFPERNFVVEVYEGDAENIDDFMVTFYQL